MLKLRIAVATVLVALTGLPVASAATHDPFAAQAEQAGLTRTQARELQAKVDAVVGATGGTQVSANEVLWRSRDGFTRLVLPGETKARSLGPAGQDTHGCDYKWMCLYGGYNYGGTLHGLFYCKDYSTPYFFGSWVNHQTPGTVGIFKNSVRREIDRTPGAYSENFGYDGSNTFYVRPC